MQSDWMQSNLNKHNLSKQLANLIPTDWLIGRAMEKRLKQDREHTRLEMLGWGLSEEMSRCRWRKDSKATSIRGRDASAKTNARNGTYKSMGLNRWNRLESELNSQLNLQLTTNWAIKTIRSDDFVLNKNLSISQLRRCLIAISAAFSSWIPQCRVSISIILDSPKSIG